ncbi:MAG TPA: protein kinase [Vicinamibacterales bacterium]|nr:protein kinase [Vicinamibacterales bacterium]
MPEFIAHYRIGAKLGQGAMGEVYRATDTKLGRDVAIKLISPALTENQSRLASFTREAQVLASLNHPNIAAIYGVEDQALVMELVEGPTLADRITQGPIPLDEALRIARQIAEGLAAAHDRGIVHRDLKPANIKLTADGTVKLLDFGLAKAAAVAAVGTDDAATVALSMVGADAIVGTPAYMAPEQARGLPLDRRADIWAFGVVLYEMLTGTRLFTGETLADVMAAVVREEPDLTRVPAAVRPVLRRCLEKDPKRRLRDAGDAVLLLETSGESPTVPTRPSGVRGWLPWAAAAAAVVAFGAVLMVHLRETPPVANTVRFNLTVPPEVTINQTTPFAVSPDGRLIAFPAVGADNVSRIWVQPLDAIEPRPLETTVSPTFPDVVEWSPDSGSILYSHDQKLKRVDINGGAPTIIASVPPGGVLGSAWHENGTILFGTLQGIMRTDESGAAPTLVTKADVTKQIVHGVFDLLPDGRHFLYSVGAPKGQRSVSVGSLDAQPDAQDTTALLKTDSGAIFVPVTAGSDEGHLFFLEGGTAFAQPFDAGARKTTGEPRPVADNVFNFDRQAFAIPYFSASAQTLVYRTGTLAENLARQLAWIGRDGKTQTTLAELGRYNQVKLSPDATKVVTSRTVLETGANADLWITDLATETSTKLTFGGGANIQPVWSPDGRFVAWFGRRGEDGVIYRKPADGSGGEDVLYRYPKMTGSVQLSDWTPGQMLVYTRGGDVFALPVGPTSSASREPIPVVQSPANEFGAAVSPDGRWIAYLSNESGPQELYVQPFVVESKSAAGTASRPKWLVSRGGSAGMARWRSDSRELIFLGGDGSIVSADVTGTPVFKAGTPQALFQLPRVFTAQLATPGALADATRDLKRLIVAVPSEAGRRQSLSVVLNWQNATSR